MILQDFCRISFFTFCFILQIILHHTARLLSLTCCWNHFSTLTKSLLGASWRVMSRLLFVMFKVLSHSFRICPSHSWIFTQIKLLRYPVPVLQDSTSLLLTCSLLLGSYFPICPQARILSFLWGWTHGSLSISFLLEVIISVNVIVFYLRLLLQSVRFLPFIIW